MVLAQRGPHRLAQQVILIRRKLARWSGTHRDHMQVGEHDMGMAPSIPHARVQAKVVVNAHIAAEHSASVAKFRIAEAQLPLLET